MTREAATAVIDQVPRGALVDGEWQTVSDGPPIEVENPGTEQPLCEVPNVGRAEALEALDSAWRAQSDWAATAAEERGEILRRAFEAVTRQRDEIALLITLEMGNPLRESLAEVTYGAEFLRWYSQEPSRIAGRYADHPGGVGRVLTRKQPIGPSS